jgi:hypothetical protein
LSSFLGLVKQVRRDFKSTALPNRVLEGIQEDDLGVNACAKRQVYRFINLNHSTRIHKSVHVTPECESNELSVNHGLRNLDDMAMQLQSIGIETQLFQMVFDGINRKPEEDGYHCFRPIRCYNSFFQDNGGMDLALFRKGIFCCDCFEKLILANVLLSLQLRSLIDSTYGMVTFPFFAKQGLAPGTPKRRFKR